MLLLRVVVSGSGSTDLSCRRHVASCPQNCQDSRRPGTTL